MRRYRPVTGAAATERLPASGPGRRALPAWMPSPTSCSRCSPCSAGARARRAQRNATTANPQGVTFAISDDAAQRAFPSELLVARAMGLSAARAYVDWSAIAPQRPAQPRNPRRSGLRLEGARRRRGALPAAPAWPCRSRSGACPPGPTAARRRTPGRWPPQDLGDFAYAVALRYPQVRLFYDWNEPNTRMFAVPNTVEAYEPMARAVYAAVHAANPAAQVVAGNLARYRDAGRDPDRLGRAAARRRRADGLLRHPSRTRCGERRSRCATRCNRIDLLDVPALARWAGVPVIVSEFGWSSDDAGLDQQAAWTAAGDPGRPLHARSRRLRLLGLPRPPGAARRHAGSVGALRLAGRRRTAQARLPRGVRRPARPARLHRGRQGRRRARGLAAARARSRSPTPRAGIRRRGARPRGRGRAARGS